MDPERAVEHYCTTVRPSYVTLQTISGMYCREILLVFYFSRRKTNVEKVQKIHENVRINSMKKF